MIVVAASLSLTACGSSGSSSSSSAATTGASANAGVKQAAALVRQAEGPVKFVAPGPAFDARKAKGKRAFFLSINESLPAAGPNIAGLRQGLAAAGVSLTVFDGKGDPSQFARGMQEAIKGKYNLIILQAIPLAVVKAGLEQAKAASIPVIESQQHDTGQAADPGTAGSVDYCFTCVGKLMADMAIAQGGTGAKAVVFDSSDIGGGAQVQTQAINNEFKRLCPTCHVQTNNVPSSDWATLLPTQTQSAVRNPDVKFIMPLYDGALTYINPAIQAANAASRVKTISFNATQAPMKELKNGQITSGDVGSPDSWLGFAFADQALRVLSGLEPAENNQLPYRAFTSANIGSIDLTKSERSWYGPVDFASDYEKLWGVK